MRFFNINSFSFLKKKNGCQKKGPDARFKLYSKKMLTVLNYTQKSH